MSLKHSSFISYFKDCFEVDKRQQVIWNLFQRKYDYLMFLNQVTFDGRDGSRYLIAQGGAAPIHKTLTLYGQEKELRFGRYLLVSKDPSANRFDMCAPLFLFESKLQQFSNGQYAIDVNPETIGVNHDALRQLADIDPVNDCLPCPTGNITTDEIASVVSWLNQIELPISRRFMDRPVSDWCNALSVKALLKELKDDEIAIVPVSVAFVERKSYLSSGLIHELEQIASKKTISSPLSQILRVSNKAKKTTRFSTRSIPAVLNRAQQKSVENMGLPLSVIVGPPGTGKTYTIAALTLAAFLENKRVLVVSNTEQAVDVIYNKLVNDFRIFPKVLLRAGRSDYHRELLAHIDSLSADPGQQETKKNTVLKEAASRVDKLVSSRFRQESHYEKLCRRAIDYGDCLTQKDSLINKVRRWWYERKVLDNPLLSQCWNDIRENIQQSHVAMIRLTAEIWKDRVSRVVRNQYDQVRDFRRAINSRRSQKRESFFNKTSMDCIFDTLPVWLVSLPNLHRVLPLTQDIFDLVIFDEATQCDLASAIPALFRAKAAVVVGDPKQLRHFSFLSSSMQHHFEHKHNLGNSRLDPDYRNLSLIDYALASVSSSDHITELDEHFRSQPDIIGFSNREFYHNQLRVMTHKPFQTDDEPLSLIECGGRYVDGVNEGEAVKIVDCISELLKADNIPTIGVVCLFSKQVDRIQSMVLKAFDSEVIAGCQLRIGTPYGFQGEERDVVLISCGVDSKCSKQVYQYINRDDAFNVAVTRARDRQLLFLSCQPDKLLRDCHLDNYVRYILACRNAQAPSVCPHDDLLGEIKSYFESRNIEVRQHFMLAGQLIDLVVRYNEKVIGIDVVGYPGSYCDYLSVNRLYLTKRAGITVYPVSFPEWYYRKTELVKQLEQWIALELPADSPLANPEEETFRAYPLLLEHQGRISAFTQFFSGSDEQKGTPEYILRQLIRHYRVLTDRIRALFAPESISYSRFSRVVDEMILAGFENLDDIVRSERARDILFDGTEYSQNEDCRHREIERELLQRISSLIQDSERIIEKMGQLTFSLLDQSTDRETEWLLKEADHLIGIADRMADM